MKRLVKCQPWHPGGVDEVPEPKQADPEVGNVLKKHPKGEFVSGSASPILHCKDQPALFIPLQRDEAKNTVDRPE